MNEITHLGKNNIPIPITPPMPKTVLKEDFDYSKYIERELETAYNLDIDKLLYSKEEKLPPLKYKNLFNKYLINIMSIQAIYEADLKENIKSIDYNQSMKEIAQTYLNSIQKLIKYKIDRQKKVKAIIAKPKHFRFKKTTFKNTNKKNSDARINAFLNREIPLGKLYYGDIKKVLQNDVYAHHHKNFENYKRHLLANLIDSEGIYTEPIENLHLKGKSK